MKHIGKIATAALTSGALALAVAPAAGAQVAGQKHTLSLPPSCFPDTIVHNGTGFLLPESGDRVHLSNINVVDDQGTPTNRNDVDNQVTWEVTFTIPEDTEAGTYTFGIYNPAEQSVTFSWCPGPEATVVIEEPDNGHDEKHDHAENHHHDENHHHAEKHDHAENHHHAEKHDHAENHHHDENHHHAEKHDHAENHHHAEKHDHADEVAATTDRGIGANTGNNSVAVGVAALALAGLIGSAAFAARRFFA
ncbi:hypothetical protein [Corynebacterium camporealensis]|uniref:YcnI-like domain-containing protein n=1 Tax=Corynebacterium camporealensis TaxID=161896 RepID=A0A0F6QW18_9CORY|nr:hypothetical protein [Corynebacterium camporealensis]AKE38705.1 hypothetical protein UL81_03645 [Corynebacterium camporealensis]